MKKILSAWIEQILEFDSTEEYNTYLNDLDTKGQRYQVMKHTKDKDKDTVKVRIRKQYNKNRFPDAALEGSVSNV